jgi:hypothetical protein
MKIDLGRNHYSAYGWELALAPEPQERRLAIHSCRRGFGDDLMWHLQAERDGTAIAWQANATIDGVVLAGEDATVRLTPEGRDAVIIEAEGCDLWLSMPKHFGYGALARPDRALVLSSQAHNYTGVAVAIGRLVLHGPEEVLSTGHRRPRGSDLRVHAVDGYLRLRLEVSADELDPRRPAPALGDAAAAATSVRAAWERFRADLAVEHPQAELAWWTLWSAFVAAEAPFAADACLMSKRFMCKVWSWDHCFNAIALAATRPRQALEQFLLPFHLQASSGALPDCLGPNAEVIWAVSKPPIHGWAFSLMLDRHAYGRDELLRVYRHLEAWSGYYRVFRDLDGDGLPEVPMGCDSQDNSAAFLGSFFVASPDVAAYLALQDRCLARLARLLGWDDEAAAWDRRCAATVTALVERLWDGGEFFCRDRNGARTPERQASVLVMPLCLGALLPPAVFAATAARLEREFLGAYGVASQAFASPLYRDDEYWLGTVWAPLQLLLCDGLAAGGRDDIARRVAGGYLAACASAGGFFEGFDARHGVGQRAQAYTWSASVALEMMRRWGRSA